jgi:predicted aspartyl protease
MRVRRGASRERATIPAVAHMEQRRDAMFAEVGFRLAGGENPLILIPTSIDDRGPYSFILDTGAGTSLISPRLADELGIVATESKEAAGAAGRVTVALAHVASIAIGGARRAPMPVAITAEVDRIGAAVGARIDGDVGYDFLKHYRVTIDYRRRLVRLVQGTYDVTSAAPATRSEVAFRLAAPTKPLVMVPAFVNGRGPYSFIVDTGASATVLSPALADALGIDRAENPAMTGAGGMLQSVVGRVTSFAVGGAVLQDLSVVVSDFLEHIGQTVGTAVDGVVGYNFLRGFRVTIDYPNGVLWMVETT